MGGGVHWACQVSKKLCSLMYIINRESYLNGIKLYAQNKKPTKSSTQINPAVMCAKTHQKTVKPKKSHLQQHELSKTSRDTRPNLARKKPGNINTIQLPQPSTNSHKARDSTSLKKASPVRCHTIKLRNDRLALRWVTGSPPPTNQKELGLAYH